MISSISLLTDDATDEVFAKFPLDPRPLPAVSLQDIVIYETRDPHQPCTPFVKNNSETFGFSYGCLPFAGWDKLNNFFKKSGIVVIFGLNALNGRVPLPDGSLGGPWDFTNAASLIRYSVNKGYTISGWELDRAMHLYVTLCSG